MDIKEPILPASMPTKLTGRLTPSLHSGEFANSIQRSGLFNVPLIEGPFTVPNGPSKAASEQLLVGVSRIAFASMVSACSSFARIQKEYDEAVGTPYNDTSFGTTVRRRPQ